ncbi:MAG: NAD(P)-dependent dehydrogenase (short-subunit alcohol dehydrogenase family) [Gammaproteobacteria bacterium]|jgi:NAD(P)-dependent dehydrogenase (short-subunit alcohol dehydrogenase family)
MHLEGKTAIVTGAGRGIGKEIALLLAKEGAIVTVNDPGVGRGGEETQDKPADEVVSEIAAAGGKGASNYDSVADYSAAGRMIQKVVDDHGKIDIIVNVAGMLRERMIWNMTEEDFDLVISVHLKGHWNMCHHAIKHMRVAKAGRIVNFSSDAFKGSVGQCNYAAAKAGIIGLTRSIARETSRYGITANAICPAADTRMTVNDAVLENRKRRLENGLMTQEQYDRASRSRGPEHIAPMVGYLCTDQAQDVNGHLFHVERGRIHNYYFGEEQKALHKGGDGLFTIDELIDDVPLSIMSEVARVAPPYEPQG